jgi:hypothetical protein
MFEGYGMAFPESGMVIVLLLEKVIVAASAPLLISATQITVPSAVEINRNMNHLTVSTDISQ